MTGNQPKAVLWDMDGVIVDSGNYHMKSWQAALGKRGVNFTEADFRRVFGMRNLEIIRGIFGENVSLETVEAIARDKEETFRSLIRGSVKALPGVLRLIRALDAAGFRQALVSSTPLENIELITTALGIKHYFRHIISGQDVKEGKPSPQGYLLAARKMDASPGNYVVIEDAAAGVEAAKNGGMKCIAVTNTSPADKLAEADLIVNSLQEVTIAVIEKLLSGNRERSRN
ncbi:MAG: HAD family phosphatase [Dehalococcoidia bacterium]|nr:HAD family phosphatase [Dehalococcoidia bacterium]